MVEHLLSPELSEGQFEQISRLLHQSCGISLNSSKTALVKARLAGRLRMLGLSGFDEYLSLLDGDYSGQELTVMVDRLTTNKTSFFREPQSFEFLRTNVLPEARREGRGIRIWSAGCSSGEEPFSIAMTVKEALPETGFDDRILATDISVRMLEKAREAAYTSAELRDVPPAALDKRFDLVGTEPQSVYRVKPEIRSMVHFARLNLISSWPMKGPFDAIFCRNVMIYFDKAAKRDLVRRFSEKLRPGGYLFVGQSESLIAVSHDLCYVQPAIYVKQKDGSSFEVHSRCSRHESIRQSG